MKASKLLVLALALFALAAPVTASAFAKNGSDDPARHHHSDDYDYDGAGHH